MIRSKLQQLMYGRNGADQLSLAAMWGAVILWTVYLLSGWLAVYLLSFALMELFAQLGALRGLSPADRLVQEKVGEVQCFITEHYYRCTDEIFLGLGRMYEEDERMRENIDRAGGAGTAAFARRAIEVFGN